MKSRRTFIKKAGLVTVWGAISPALAQSGLATTTQIPVMGAEEIGFSQQPLPYLYSALEPVIDALTMEIHYTKHAAGYTKNLVDACAGEKVDTSKIKLTELLSRISTYSIKMRNNAGGHYNHEFFWQSLTPVRSGLTNKPSGSFMEAIVNQFGSFENFQTQFSDAARNRFGSGWAWLVKTTDGKLKIGSTPNQDNPLMDLSELKGTPLLGLDVWEHAYYLKYQNKRPDYIAACWSLFNWEVLERRYKNA
ncbi:MAG: superoxide dismutase [Bacteroidota bacterium]